MNFKRILALILCLLMLVTCVMPLVACGDKDDECSQHVDENADGKCDECEEEVSIDCSSHKDDNGNSKCDICGKDMSSGAVSGNTQYTVNVKSLGGMPLEGVTVYIYKADGNFAARPNTTDAAGNAVFDLPTEDGYTIELVGVPEGYNVKTGSTAEDRYPMSSTGVTPITLVSSPVTSGNLQSNYNLGDVMYDFTITDVNGVTYKLSELLATKKMVMLNFWYTDCSWCNKEFPGLNDSYENYKDKIEILALNDYGDSLTEIKNFPITGSYAEDNLTFPFFKVNKGEGNLTIDKFGGFGSGNTGYPTSIIIDRYGVICMIEQGAIVGEAKWDKIFDHFTADTYNQMLVTDSADLTPAEKPNIEFPGSDAIANNFSSSDLTAVYSPDDNEYSWPFVPGDKDGIKFVKPSNKSDNSYSILYASIQLKPGQAVMFDYFSSCEYASERLVVIVEGEDIYSITGVNGGSLANLADWEQCCAYVDPRPVTSSNKDDLVTYQVAFTYIKDTEGNDGDDTVYLRNLRIISANDIPTETYIKRDAASDPTSDGAGFNTYIDYVLGDDGYYHVSTKDGPLLLVDFLGYTKFDSYKTVSQRLMEVEEILVNGVDMYNYWMVFANASSNSTFNGLTPIDKTLKDILVAYCNLYKNEVGKDSNDNLWLQLCVYYDAYGKDKDGNPTKQLENPIKGITTFAAFDVQENQQFADTPTPGDKIECTVTYDRVIMPRGFLYRFTPKTSGVYRVTSHSKDEVHGWIFTGNSFEWMATGTQERTLLVDFEEEERYPEYLLVDTDGDGVNETRDTNNVSLVAYMEAGKDYYIDIAYYNIYAEGTFTFDVMYIAPEDDVFVMASPGPITYYETVDGSMGELIALGIDYAFKADGYVYQVLERDAAGNPTVYGGKLYADLIFPTIPFPSQSIVELADAGAFDFSKSELDKEAMIYLDNIRADGKTAIISKWINEGKANAAELWSSKNLDTILELVQKGADVSSYPAEDVNTAREALEIGTLALKKEWGIEALGNSESWTEYKMDEALKGTLSSDPQVKEVQENVLLTIENYWKNTYKMDDVLNGIYHGTGVDETAKIREYIANQNDGSAEMNGGVERIELQGCVAVDKELAEILHKVYEKYVFQNVENDWLKFCFYYKHLGA